MKKATQYPENETLANNCGFKVNPKEENGYLYAVNFSREFRHVWQCIDRRMGGIVWQTADLIDGKYCNHKKFKDLYEAFKHPMNYKTLRGYKNTNSTAGKAENHIIEIESISRIYCWFNSWGNPSYVFHLDSGDYVHTVDDYGAMNDIYNLSRELVERKKDMF